MRISGISLTLTVYTQPAPKSSLYSAEDKQVVFNFYASEAQEAFEFVITDEEQIERLGKRLLKFSEGANRSRAIERLARSCHAEIIEDPKQDDKLVLVL